MPTPFTHLAVAQRLLDDPEIPEPYRARLNTECGAFLLGNVAADARVHNGAPRGKTHFYNYGQDFADHPWRVMVRQYPELLHPVSAGQQMFVAGYVSHLSVDEMWSKLMVGPHFSMREWAERSFRFYMLHIILAYMDERDLESLGNWQGECLAAVKPESWLPFLNDEDLGSWQHLISDQLVPGGISQTLEIFSERIGKSVEEMRAILDAPDVMRQNLWDHISLDLLAYIEHQMYDHARSQMMAYIDESEICDRCS